MTTYLFDCLLCGNKVERSMSIIHGRVLCYECKRKEKQIEYAVKEKGRLERKRKRHEKYLRLGR